MAGIVSVLSVVVQSVGSPALVVGGITILLYLIYQGFFQEGKKFPPGPTGLPVFGSVFSLLLTKRQQHEVVNEWSHKYGPIFAFKMLGTRVYVLTDPGLVSDAFHSSPDINDRMSMAIADEVTGRPNNGEHIDLKDRFNNTVKPVLLTT